MSILFSVGVSAFMLLFGRFFLRLFIDSANENAEEVLRVAYSYLVILSCTLIALYLLHIFRNMLQGFGNSFVPFLSGIMEFMARVSVALFFSGIWGSQVIFLAEPLAWTAAAVVLAAMCIRKVKAMPTENLKTYSKCEEPENAGGEFFLPMGGE